MLIHLAGELFIYSGAYNYAPALAGAQFPFRVLLGPALYFYAHATMSPDKVIDKRLWILVVSSPILVLLAMLPFIFLISPSEKLALANPSTRDSDLWKVALFTCFFAPFIFILVTAFILGLAFSLHSSHRQQLMERFSDIGNVHWAGLAL